MPRQRHVRRHSVVSYGVKVKGEHEKPWGNSYAAIADNVPLL